MRLLDKYTDVCPSDKQLFTIWNSFIHDINLRKTIPNNQMYSTCLRFCQENAEKLRGMRPNLLAHLLMLVEYRLLTKDEFYKTMLEYDKIQESLDNQKMIIK